LLYLEGSFPELLLMGGKTPANQYLNDVWRSRDFGQSWTRVLARAPWRPRTYFATCHNGSAYVLLGGATCAWRAYDSGLVNDVWISMDSGESWTQLPITLPSHFAFSPLCAFVTPTKLIVHGGCAMADLTCANAYCEYSNTMMEVDLETGQVNLIQDAPSANRRAYLSIDSNGSRFIAAGGKIPAPPPNTYVDSAYCYTSSNRGQTWTAMDIGWPTGAYVRGLMWNNVPLVYGDAGLFLRLSNQSTGWLRVPVVGEPEDNPPWHALWALNNVLVRVVESTIQYLVLTCT